MFSYYGSKSKIVNFYPYPKYDKIIEPFAGSARYSLLHYKKDITLVDKYDKIVKIWKWLQQACPNDILKMPTPKLKETIKREDYDCDEQFWLMGFIIQQGVSRPGLTVSPYAYNKIKQQKEWISKHLYKIKHWEIIHGDYVDIKNEECTWYIDPPYQYGGEYYKISNKHLDYSELAEWCKTRNGQVIVCENSKADWLPFRKLSKLAGSIYITAECIWSNLPTKYDNEQLNLYEKE